ncbi:MAG TPA: YdeI/OmpD-associated family protein [Steroidobacteraceae bacterium]
METVKVPYATKWQKEADRLRKIALDCGLTEETKWGKRCFTHQNRNLAIIIPLKETCAFSFFKGALLRDPEHILQKVGEHTQSGRWIKFTSVKEITAMQSILRNYIYEAIKIEESGKKVIRKKASEYVVPEELQALLDEASELRAAFEALTPGRRKSYIFHISGAKQVKTRVARAKRCVPLILSGRGFNEYTD